MAREIITKIWCDPCMDKDQLVEGEEIPPVTIGTMKPRVVAMCEPCRKEFFDPLKGLLLDMGQLLPEQTSVSTATRRASKGRITAYGGKWFCPVLDCTRHEKSPYKHEQSMRGHMRDKHEMTMTEAIRIYGDNAFSRPDLVHGDGEPQLAFDEDNPEPEPAEVEFEIVTVLCGETGCDVGYTNDENQAVDSIKYTARPNQAVGVHRAKSHGVKGSSKVPKADKIRANA